MSENELLKEIADTERYLIGSDLIEDAKDALRGQLQAAKSGNERDLIVLLVCASVRERVREAARIKAVANAAVTDHEYRCMQSRRPSDPQDGPARLAAYVKAVQPVATPVCWMVAIIGAAGQLPAFWEILEKVL